jgi:hypothetical protein
MNSMELVKEAEIQVTDQQNAEVVSELHLVELAYVGGGMANVAWG